MSGVPGTAGEVQLKKYPNRELLLRSACCFVEVGLPYRKAADMLV